MTGGKTAANFDNSLALPESLQSLAEADKRNRETKCSTAFAADKRILQDDNSDLRLRYQFKNECREELALEFETTPAQHHRLSLASHTSCFILRLRRRLSAFASLVYASKARGIISRSATL